MKTNKKSGNEIKKEAFSESVLSKIKKEHIEMIPKWRFLLREYVFWFFLCVSIIVGAIAVYVIILHILEIDIAIAVRASGGVMQHIVLLTPYIWLFLLGIFIFLSWFNFKHTKRGYKYSYILVVLGSIALSIVFGIVLYFAGVADHAERYATRIGGAYYRDSSMNRREVWTQPEKGLLAGVPLAGLVEGVTDFDLVDFTGKTWAIDARRLDKRDMAIIAVSPRVAIIGIEHEAGLFEACRVVPWAKRANRRQMRHDILKFTNDKSITERNIFLLRSNACEEK